MVKRIPIIIIEAITTKNYNYNPRQGQQQQQNTQPQHQQPYGQNYYMTSGRNQRTAFDNNGAPEKKMMENYRDGSERFDNYRVKNTVSRFDSNTLQKRRNMENYRDGSERFGGGSYDDPTRFDRPVPYATRPKKADRDYSRTRSVSQNFANGDPRGYEYNNPNNSPNPRIYGTRPSPKETVRREMNSISRTLYNGESQLPEYSRYPDARMGRSGNLPKLVATRPKPDPKYKQVTRHLNGQTPQPLVDPTKPGSPNTMSSYNANQLPGYSDEQEKRYGGTSSPL